MKTELERKIAAAVQELFEVTVTIDLTRPDEQFGDFATNVALQLSKQVGHNPRVIAEQLADKLQADLTEQVADISIAGPGFLNLKLTDNALLQMIDLQPSQTL